jgi:hypothetical protein
MRDMITEKIDKIEEMGFRATAEDRSTQSDYMNIVSDIDKAIAGPNTRGVNWEYERSSGYPGWRCSGCNRWVYDDGCNIHTNAAYEAWECRCSDARAESKE